jgi:DNA-binding response OmpR family regulator
MNKPIALIIEDDPKQADIFAKTFASCGFESTIYLRGDEAIAALETIVPDVVMLDMHMPYIAGSNILKYIRDTEQLVNTFVLVATADLYMAKGDVAEQADIVMIKPVSFRKLQNLANELYSEKNT